MCRCLQRPAVAAERLRTHRRRGGRAGRKRGMRLGAAAPVLGSGLRGHRPLRETLRLHTRGLDAGLDVGAGAVEGQEGAADMAPTLVPTTMSTGTRNSSSTRSTRDVRQPARAAARQHQGHLRAGGRRSRFGGLSGRLRGHLRGHLRGREADSEGRQGGPAAQQARERRVRPSGTPAQGGIWHHPVDVADVRRARPGCTVRRCGVRHSRTVSVL